MSINTIRKCYVSVQFWFKSWSKDKDFYVLENIINAIKQIKTLISEIDVRAADVEDRVLLATVVRETNEIETMINVTPNVGVVVL